MSSRPKKGKKKKKKGKKTETKLAVPATPGARRRVMEWESLHNHTTRSDGELSYADFLDEAARRGAGVIAFTDHDALPTDADLAMLRARPQGARPHWIVGVELSSGTAAGPSGSIHVVGLFVDPHNQALAEHCRNAQQARRQRLEAICRNLAKIGITVTPSDCERAAIASGSDLGSLGRPHIASAIAASPSNVRRVYELLADVAERSETDSALAARLARINAQTDFERKLYPLLLTENAIIPGVYVGYGTWKTVAECTQLIHNAGGISVIAHYATALREIPFPELRKMLTGRTALDGAETIFNDIEGAPQNVAGSVEKLLRECSAGGTVLVAAGGGDIHKREQIAAYATSPHAQRSVGLTKAILGSGLVSREAVAASSSLCIE